MLQPRGCAELWKVALQEALDGSPLTDGYHSRAFRGERLLAAVDSRGADYAAWSFLADEAASPDLAALGISEAVRAHAAADEARKERIGWTSPPPEALEEPAAAPAPRPEPAPAAPEPDFETCSRIVLTVDPALNAVDVEWLGDRIARMKGEFTGTRSVSLVLRWARGQTFDRWGVGRFELSEDDLDAIRTKFRDELDADFPTECE